MKKHWNWGCFPTSQFNILPPNINWNHGVITPLIFWGQSALFFLQQIPSLFSAWLFSIAFITIWCAVYFTCLFICCLALHWNTGILPVLLTVLPLALGINLAQNGHTVHVLNEEWVKCAMNEQCVSCTVLHVGNAIVHKTSDNFALRNALSNPHLPANKIF